MKFINTKRVFPNLRFGIEGICSYCGETAETIDHVIPHCVIDQRNNKRKSTDAGNGLTTPSCKFCNNHLGEKFFPTWTQRVNHMKKVFSKKAKKYRKAGSWSEDELNELDYMLRVRIREDIHEMERLDRQILWEYSPAYKRVFYEVEQSGYFLDIASPCYETINEFFDNLQTRQKPRMSH